VSEQINYDSEHQEDNGFFIEVKNGKVKTRKPLSSWGLVKELKCSLLVRTEKSNFGNLEQPTIPELYQINLTYTINPSAKNLYIKKEMQHFDNEAIMMKIFLRDVNSGITQPCPLPNQLNNGEYEVTIMKSKGEIISVKDSVKLLKSGECLGIFDSSLTKAFLF
jgi:hypothetical protein